MLQKTIFKQGKKAVYKIPSSGSCKEKSMFGNITREEYLRWYIIISKCVNRFPTRHVFSSLPK